MLISTNILRDNAGEFQYIVTANTQRIFNQIESSVGERISCFNLIGSYGTGKSSFLLALESTLNGRAQFFKREREFSSSAFLKIIGQPRSLKDSFARLLECSADQDEIITALKYRAKQYDSLIILVDEFGKSLEFAVENKPKEEIYFLQVLAEAINDDNNIVFISTLHQNFDAYGSGASVTDALEWEKVSGRFTAINFNEPPETLVKLAAQRLSKESKENISPSLNKLVRGTGLIPLGFIEALEEGNVNTSPFDHLTAYVVVSLLQKYGQNERSLFTFLNAKGRFTLKETSNTEPYLLHNFYDYAIDRLGHIIYSATNPDKLQWEAAERALQRADYHDTIKPTVSHAILKSILLINLFTREKGEFNLEVAIKYLNHALGQEAIDTIHQLADKSIIQYLRYKNKLVFVEGTDVNIQAELLEANRRIPAQIDISIELERLAKVKPVLAKRHYLITGTPRFAEFYFDALAFETAVQNRDGNAKVLIDTKKGQHDGQYQTSMALYCKLSRIKSLETFVKEVLAHEVILEKYSKDFSVKQIIQRELDHAIDAFDIAFTSLLFGESEWRNYSGVDLEIKSEQDFNRILSDSFNDFYEQAPHIKNELINKTKLSGSINSGRRNLIRVLLNRLEDSSLGFIDKKFPAEKSIFNSVFVNEGLYDYETGFISAPNETSSYFPLWNACIEFLDESRHGRKSLQELINRVMEKPFGLKDGLVRIWLMFFLVAEEENYALYYLPNDKFLPYFSDDIYENILKKPENFAVKRYNYDKLPAALLEEYKRNSLYLDEPRGQSARSTYFRLYGELLTKFKNLPAFTLKTKSRLSEKARYFRQAVLDAKDPEDCLTGQIPLALGYSDLSSLKAREISDYFKAIREVEEELGQCYDFLLDEIYQEMADCVGMGKDVELSKLKSYFIELKQSVDLNTLNKETKVLLQRLSSPLDIKASWVKASADAIHGSNIEKIEDAAVTSLLKAVRSRIDDLITTCQINSNEGGDRFTVKMVLPDGTVLSRTLGKSSKDSGEKNLLKSQRIEALANQLLEELTK